MAKGNWPIHWSAHLLENTASSSTDTSIHRLALGGSDNLEDRSRLAKRFEMGQQRCTPLNVHREFIGLCKIALKRAHPCALRKGNFGEVGDDEEDCSAVGFDSAGAAGQWSRATTSRRASGGDLRGPKWQHRLYGLRRKRLRDLHYQPRWRTTHRSHLQRYERRDTYVGKSSVAGAPSALQERRKGVFPERRIRRILRCSSPEVAP